MLASYLTEKLLEKELINKSQQELYAYGLERVIGKIINYGSIMILAVVKHRVVLSIIFILFFVVLRSWTGGYHAKTKGWCMLGTILIYLISMQYMLPILEKRKDVILIGLSVATLVVWWWAPVNHPNISFDEIEVRQYRKRSRIVLIIELIVIFLLKLVNVKNEYYISASLGIEQCSFLIFMAKMFKQEVKAE